MANARWPNIFGSPGFHRVVHSGNPLYPFESNRPVAFLGESYDSDPVVQFARVTALSCQTAVQRSTSAVSAATC